MTRRRSYGHRRLRAEIRQWAADSRGLLIQLLALGIAVLGLGLALTIWLPGTNTYMQGFMAGVVLTSLVAMVAFAFFLTTGSIFRVAGTLAEDGVRDELEHAKRAGHIHGYVTNVELDGYDIDALVVTSGGVLAVETKWHRTWPDSTQLARDAAAAASAARHARSVLRAIGHADTPLTGVLLLCSPEPCPWEEPRLVDGIQVMAGDQLRPWLMATGRPAQDAEVGRALATELEHFAHTHGPQATAKGSPVFGR